MRCTSFALASQEPEWFETTDGWPTLRAHVLACKVPGCSCRDLLNNFSKWSKRLPAKQEACDGRQTWLWFRFTRKNMLRWVCLFCHAGRNDSTDDGGQPQSIQISNLLVHQRSTSHLEAVARRLGDASIDVNYSTPPAKLFKELYKAFQSGETPTAGFTLPSGHVCFDKANELLWCLYEADGDIKREYLADAFTINILRDERLHRMHVRYRCIGTDNVVHKGYLGQSRDHNPDAIGLTNATVEVFRAVCTSRSFAPQTAHAVAPVFDQALFKKVCNLVEAISVDSAENEAVSAADMSKKRPDGSDPPFPNCVHILRDWPHSARRILSRLWKADAFLDHVFTFFTMIASIIHWSEDLRQLYQQCTNESTDAAVDSRFGHMRAAKHRIESQMKPLSRCCLDPSGGHIFNNTLFASVCLTNVVQPRSTWFTALLPFV